jgi:hypothetical protein
MNEGKGWKLCCLCGIQFHSYVKTRKYCSHNCYVKDQKERIVANSYYASKQPKNRKILGRKCVCKVCNMQFRNLNKTNYCEKHKLQAKIAQASHGGRKKDENKKITKKCLHCKNEFKHYKTRKQIYCSYDCHIASGGAWRAGLSAKEATLKYGAKKDANHNEVVDALKEAGASVIDMSHVGRGFPDLIVGFNSQTLLMEIKNPKTSYGKKGLNKNQLKWREQWIGGTYCIVDSVESALKMIGII